MINDKDSKPRLAMLVEATYVQEDDDDDDESSEADGPKHSAQHENLRSIETLRHLPVSVAQFTLDGKVLTQNPQDSKEFPECTRSRCPLVDRFVDTELGQQVFEQVKEGKDVDIEAQQFPPCNSCCKKEKQHGKRSNSSGSSDRNNSRSCGKDSSSQWYAIKLKLVKDPVTSKNVILCIAQNITDRVQAKRDKSEADRANLAKSEFLAVMAHELRTPLHQVIGWIDLLGQTKLNEEQGNFLSLMEASALHFMAIINDMLDFTKFEAGKLELERIPFEPFDVLEGSVAAMTAGAHAKNIKLISSISETMGQVVIGDPNRLRQILLNLLSNAVKFTSKGSVTVRAQQHIQASDFASSSSRLLLRVEVEDTGIGITEEHQERIFQNFQQADPSVARNYGGTGLGLAICQKLVSALGGEIGVSSQLGVGTTFWFELPLAKMDSHDDSHRKPRISKLVQPIHSSDEKSDETSTAKVLVAEDNVVNQKVVQSMLRRMGHNVIIVENGKLAVDIVHEQDFDVILMDYQMPVMDGLEATQLIREAGFTVPIIGLTASITAMDEGIGITSRLSKPIRLPELKKAIENVLHRGDLAAVEQQ